MLRDEQMAVAVQYAPRLDLALLVQCYDHARDDVVEPVNRGP